jgi:hypothetical protein
MAPEAVVGRLAHILGLTETAAPIPARALVERFTWARIPRGPVRMSVPS